jgi:hypothetical protein
VLLVAAAVFLFTIGSEFAIHLAPPDTVPVSAADQTSGQLLASRTITDQRIVADLYSRINHLPSTAGLEFNCPLSGPAVLQMTFRFTRLGFPLETAVHHGDGCEFWSLSSGGIQEPFARWDPGGAWGAITDDVQLRCPGEWQQQCDGY